MERRGHAMILAALIGCAAAGGLFLAGETGLAAAVVVGAGVLGALGVRGLSRVSLRTRMRPDRLGTHDTALIVVSAVVATGAMIARRLVAAQWYPYPAVTWPAVDGRLIALAFALAAPVPIAAALQKRVRAASRAAVAERIMEHA
jgi:hypothetical protein